MWKKWAVAAIIYLIVVMAGYGIYNAFSGSVSSPANQMDMKK